MILTTSFLSLCESTSSFHALREWSSPQHARNRYPRRHCRSSAQSTRWPQTQLAFGPESRLSAIAAHGRVSSVICALVSPTHRQTLVDSCGGQQPPATAGSLHRCRRPLIISNARDGIWSTSLDWAVCGPVPSVKRPYSETGQLIAPLCFPGNVQPLLGCTVDMWFTHAPACSRWRRHEQVYL